MRAGLAALPKAIDRFTASPQHRQRGAECFAKRTHCYDSRVAKVKELERSATAFAKRRHWFRTPAEHAGRLCIVDDQQPVCAVDAIDVFLEGGVRAPLGRIAVRHDCRSGRDASQSSAQGSRVVMRKRPDASRVRMPQLRPTHGQIGI